MALRNTQNLVIELEILGVGENEVIQEMEYKGIWFGAKVITFSSIHVEFETLGSCTRGGGERDRHTDIKVGGVEFITTEFCWTEHMM